MSDQPRIAIVGMGGLFPRAGSPRELWDNVLAGLDAAGEPPPGRWLLPPEAVHAPGEPRPDRVPSVRACFLDPFTPNMSGMDLPPGLVAQLDPVFQLALAAGGQAWRSARMEATDRQRVGVILGAIALPTDTTSELTRKVLGREFFEKLGRPNPSCEGPLPHPLNRHVTGLPAGILARAFGLGGCAFTLDAACATSLYAIKLAADELAAGRADAMLAGGLSRPDSLFTQMGFAQLRALSPTGRCSPFDERGDGLVVGEGAGVFVLKRLDDALAHGDRVLGVIAGIGLSNDIGGGLLAPASEGQLRAMRAAYARAGWRPDEVDLIECHATGTPVGDAVEFQSLRTLWEGYPARRDRCVLGSVKSSVGHLLTGAGAAALTKVLFALNEGVLPPTANFTRPQPGLEMERSPFEVLREPRPWPQRQGKPRRAAVSAFGFGGINAHLLVEEYREPPAQPFRHPAPSVTTGEGDVEVAVVGVAVRLAPDRTLADLRRELYGAPPPPLAPAAHAWGIDTPPGQYFEGVRVPAGAFRIPPREIEEMLPQQALALLAARDALRQTRLPGTSHPDVGVFLGVALDLGTTNFHLRWLALRDAPGQANAAGPALNANRTMGALASIAASRIAREFRLGGPSFTLSCGAASGLRAVELATQAIRQGEISAAVVGAADLADVRETQLTGHPPVSAAAVLVLKRLDAARRDGDTVHAVVRAAGTGPGPASPDVLTFPPPADWGAASGLLSAVNACLCLGERLWLEASPLPWLRDRAAGPRHACAEAANVESAGVHVVLQEGDLSRRAGKPAPEGLFVVEAETLAEMRTGLDRLEALVRQPGDGIETLARRAWKQLGRTSTGTTGRAAVFVPRDRDELRRLLGAFREHLDRGAQRPLPAHVSRDRIFYSPDPLGGQGQIGFVYPGSGNDFPGMGRDVALRWPGLLERQQRENEHLAGQYLPERFWREPAATATVKERIFAQVALGSLVTDALIHLGVHPEAAIGYSLGESSALFSLRTWANRDEMLRRMNASPLFVSDLTGPCDAARAAWHLTRDEKVDWLTGIVERSADEVRDALAGLPRAYLQIINTPRECVVGGQREQVNELVRRLHCSLVPVPETTTMHCAVVRPAAEAYRDLHLLPATPPEGLRFYSCGLGHAYDVDSDSAADAILAQALDTVDFPATVRSAYRDGVRLFVEAGPGGSCSRMISAILGDLPHVARSACVPGPDGLAALWRVAAQLIAERVPVDVEKLVGSEEGGEESGQERSRNDVIVPVGGEPFRVTDTHAPSALLGVSRSESRGADATPLGGACAPPLAAAGAISLVSSQIDQSVAVVEARSLAHSAYLRLSGSLRHTFARTLEIQGRLHEAILSGGMPDHVPLLPSVPSGGTAQAVPAVRPAPALNREQCLEFAIGAAGNVLGPAFAEADTFPTRVRLPDEPLMLVDRILTIEGEPLSLTHGRVVTEHDVLPGAWYLDGGRIPTCVAVEAGQADLFLSGYLGIDLRTRGLAVYRLLDAAVTFHRGLPGPGETIRYDIHIDNFFRQGDTHLFRFRFVGTVNGEPLLTMTDGCAGFFSEEELAAGKGVVHTEWQRQQRPGVVPDDAGILPPLAAATYTESQVDRLRVGDLAGCFGPLFAGLPLRAPQSLPGGKMRLVHRVSELDPKGGRFGIGRIRAEADIHPDDWFLTCHFIDDQVMPGTLMYECCLHSFRIFLMRLGWVGEHAEVVCEPVPGVTSKLKCRGQVLASTKEVTYEIVLKERGYRPEPYAIADAHMYADGKLIVDIENMSVRFTGLTREKVAAIWSGRTGKRPAPYERRHILAFATGKPSEAFGDRYRIFDEGRFIARLPAPPYSFLDRVVRVEGEPWKMRAGTAAEAEYDVPPDEWYFASERAPVMPFCVLAEIPLQVCGWLAAFMGSALTSEMPLHFRNLGITAELFRPVTPQTGTLTTRVRCSRVASSGGMIVQDYELETRDRHGPVYRGVTTFGFFSAQALAQQVGIRDAKPYVLTEDERGRGTSIPYPEEAPFPDRRLRMIDDVSLFVPDGGPAGLGYVEGTKRVNPDEWFFAAHFYQDPVMPGSLGLEAMLQLLKLAAARRWNAGPGTRFEANLGKHNWTYRGQVIPRNKEMRVRAVVTACDEGLRQITGDGYLSVDGLEIYLMTGFTIRAVPE